MKVGMTLLIMLILALIGSYVYSYEAESVITECNEPIHIINSHDDVYISQADYDFVVNYFKNSKIEKALCFNVTDNNIHGFLANPQYSGRIGKTLTVTTWCNTKNGWIHNHPVGKPQYFSVTDNYNAGRLELKIYGLYRNEFDDVILYKRDGVFLSFAKLVIK